MNLHDGCGDNEGYEGWHDNLRYHSESCYHLSIPQHDGRHVADRGECSARIRRYYDADGIPYPVPLVCHEFVQNHYHDD